MQQLAIAFASRQRQCITAIAFGSAGTKKAICNRLLHCFEAKAIANCTLLLPRRGSKSNVQLAIALLRGNAMAYCILPFASDPGPFWMQKQYAIGCSIASRQRQRAYCLWGLLLAFASKQKQKRAEAKAIAI